MVGIISVVIGGHFGGGDHFDGGDHFGGGTSPAKSDEIVDAMSTVRGHKDACWYLTCCCWQILLLFQFRAR